MSLDSTEILSKVGTDILSNGLEPSDPEIKECPIYNDKTAWCYIYTHRAKVSSIIKKLEALFNVFIHKTIVYEKKTHVKAEEKPTISGLIFIQGTPNDINRFLNENFPNIYLVKDCSTGKPAVISHKLMSSFMQLSNLEPDRIRFMPNPFEYYSKGHIMVKITSGVMKGMEGYIVRISRNKCLITSVGGLTVAISGVHKETFENLEELMEQFNEGKAPFQVSEVIGQIYETLK